jgi:hypothetical protein
MKHLSSFICLCLGLLFITNIAIAQEKFTVSGHIKDAANGEGLIGATVQVQGQAIGAATNEYGFYSLTLPKGNYSLVYTYIGFVAQTKEVVLQSNQKIEIQLVGEQVMMDEVVITATKPDNNVKSMEMGVSKLDIKTIKAIPALFGEVDVVRSIQLLPGVSTVGEGASGFNVRGGGVDHNLILLDEAPVYNSSHLFGFFSVFNPDAVKDIKLVKGGIPAQYGGRLASLLDVRLKEGNSKRFGVSGGVGTIFSRLAIEGPIVKDKGSFIVAGRRSYADIFLKLSSDEGLKNSQLYFYDLTAKANYTINDRNRVFLSAYFGKDNFKFAGDDDASFMMNWGNTTGTLRWNHLFNDRLFSNVSAIYSDYNYSLGVPKGSQAFEWVSRIINYNAKADFTYYLNSNNTITFGGGALLYRFHPGEWKPLTENSIFTNITVPHKQAVEYAAYIDNEQSFGPKFSMQYGLRYSAYNYLGSQTVYDYEGTTGERKTPVNPREYDRRQSIKLYNNLEPRFSLRYSLNEQSSIKASYNRMAQYVHLISNSTAASPLDVWSPTTNNIKPEIADQVAVGYFRNFKDNMFETSVEAFYKTMTNQIDYINGADLLLNEQLEADLLYGKGRAYGVELYVKKNVGRLNGWVSYTLSRSERQIDGLNNNKYYPNKYDKTHILSVVGIYQLSRRLSFSSNFSYSTGVATTFPNGRYEWNGLTVPHNTDNSRNNYRVPAYNRLDIGATLDNKKKPGQRFEGQWVFSIYNVYSRRNPFTVYFRQNEDNPNKTEAVRLSIFGSLIPSVAYNFKF